MRTSKTTRRRASRNAQKPVRAIAQNRRLPKSPQGKLIGYARVSTEDQELRLQLDALERAGCWNVWKEKRSASRGKRPELDKAIMDLRPGDTLVVWRLDRLARNARELYARLDDIHAAGAQFKSLTEQFDFTTAMGQFVLGILALVAQLEAQMTSARTTAGMRALKERGYKLGAPRALSDAKEAEIVKLRRAKVSVTKLARKFKVSTGTINNVVKRHKAKRRR